jgi:hypothetical protein
MLAEAQAAFTQASPFVAYMNNGQPYQVSQYPGGPPAFGQPQSFPPPLPPPLPQEQLAGAGGYGQGR